MLPTLSAAGDGVCISARHRRGRGVRVGDCVDFEHPLVPGVRVIKRVVGMPGDFVEVPRAVGGVVEMGPFLGDVSKQTGMMIQVCVFVYVGTSWTSKWSDSTIGVEIASLVGELLP